MVSDKSFSALSNKTLPGGRGRQGEGETWRYRCNIFSLPPSLPISLSCLIGPRCPCRDTGGDVEGDEALAEAGVADKERDFANGNAAGPEPIDWFHRDIGGAADVRLFFADADRFMGEFGDSWYADGFHRVGLCGWLVCATKLRLRKRAQK
jgi:hypothetical protein